MLEEYSSSECNYHSLLFSVLRHWSSMHLDVIISHAILLLHTYVCVWYLPFVNE